MPTGKPIPKCFQNEGRTVLLLGGLGEADEIRFGSTQYAKAVLGSLWGLPPKLDMGYEKRVHEAMRSIAAAGLAESSHDLSAGGLGCALGLSTLGGIGAGIVLNSAMRAEFLLFHEAPSRILVSTAHPDQVLAVAQQHQVTCMTIGVTMKERLQIRNGDQILIQASTREILQPYESAFPTLLHHA